MSLIDIATISFISRLAKAVLKGSKWLKFTFFVAFLLILIAIAIAALVDSGLIYRAYNLLAGALGAIGGTIILIIYAYQTNVEQAEAKREIKEVEDRAKENPKEPTAAWDLARLKLENYLNRNLTQIQSIFIWTVIIMIAGFVLIVYGIMQAFTSSQNLNPSIIATTSGILVEFIGATFLALYKSSMLQAKDYVNVLERINAVGMSVQIFESIDDTESKLKDQTKAEISKQLLTMYAIDKKSSKMNKA